MKRLAKRLWRRWGRAVTYPMLLAQVVGLAKAEATIRLTWVIADPWWLRVAVYGLGVVLAVVVSALNVALVRRLN